MAIMLPDNPKDFDPRSKEDIMFESLKKLPDDYYVFHSFRITQITNNVIRENEIDFLIFNKNKGILCIEAKAGCVRYENGSWVYSNGTPMKYNSPYTKASLDKHNLLNRINNYKKSKIDFIGKCKFLHAVWFPDYDFQKFLKACLPSEADTKLTLTNTGAMFSTSNQVYNRRCPLKGEIFAVCQVLLGLRRYKFYKVVQI